MQAQSITTAAATHRNARLNRAILAGTFRGLYMLGASHELHIRLMRDTKQQIRERDAEPAAWFTGPTRTDWVTARMDRGEQLTDREIGQALRGVSHA